MALEPLIDPGKLNSSQDVYGIAPEVVRIGDLYQETAYSHLAKKSTTSRVEGMTEETVGVADVVRRPGTDKLVVVYNHDRIRHAHDTKNAGYVFAVVHEARSLVEEAELMTRLHGQAPRLNDAQQHMLNVSRGEPVAVEIEKILNAHNLTGMLGQTGKIRVVAIASLRYAFGGDAGRGLKVVLTQKQIQRGIAVLNWVMRVFAARFATGDAVNAVMRKAIIHGLIEIARYGTTVPSSADMFKALAPYDIKGLKKLFLDKEYKNSRSAVWAHNAVGELNRAAGSTIVVLPPLNKG